jgi:hypothetical protein
LFAVFARIIPREEVTKDDDVGAKVAPEREVTKEDVGAKVVDKSVV